MKAVTEHHRNRRKDRMTLDCTKTLQLGSKGESVKELQTLLQKKGFYNGITDGDYGQLTKTAVTKYQKQAGTLLADGICGPVTCKHLQKNTQSSQTKNTEYNYYKNGVYHAGPYWIGTGCNKMGQCTPYYCACCSIRQQLTKLGIENYTQQTIAKYAGTTTAGTSHQGIETAIARISRETGVKLRVTWKNFSDFGNTQQARFEGLGKLLIREDTGVFLHTLYQNKYGHYETIQEINMNNNTALILNSLGSKCGSPAYCGRKETRSWNVLARNLAGISQKSVCIITKI